MGAEVEKLTFNTDDYQLFQNKLAQEVLLMHHWIKSSSKAEEEPSFGVEMEGWLIDSNGHPQAKNTEFLSALNKENVVSELSQYNIEINGSPQEMCPNVFDKMLKDIKESWKGCQAQAKKLGYDVLAIGSLPTLLESDFDPTKISKGNRYTALNKEVFRAHQGHNIPIVINGKDRLKLFIDNVVFAGAATSFQYHWKVPLHKAHLYYNASLVASAPTVALSANTPFMFGKSLWQESRIPFFEHSVSGAPTMTHFQGKNRAGFGAGFLNQYMSEYFIEIAQNYPVFIPDVKNNSVEHMCHLKLHNGTIWRWNRPVIGHDDKMNPHIRIEHRTPSAGPTLIDNFANMAFYIGLVNELVHTNTPVSIQHNQRHLEQNFYRAAQNGLQANVLYAMKKAGKLQDFTMEYLLPLAYRGLINLGVDKDCASYYLLKVIKERLESGQTGSQWQINFADKYKRDFKNLTLKYKELQEQETPVSEWGL